MKNQKERTDGYKMKTNYNKNVTSSYFIMTKQQVRSEEDKANASETLVVLQSPQHPPETRIDPSDIGRTPPVWPGLKLNIPPVSTGASITPQTATAGLDTGGGGGTYTATELLSH